MASLVCSSSSGEGSWGVGALGVCGLGVCALGVAAGLGVGGGWVLGAAVAGVAGGTRGPGKSLVGVKEQLKYNIHGHKTGPMVFYVLMVHICISQKDLNEMKLWLVAYIISF